MKKQSFKEIWSNIDTMSDPGHFIQFLDAFLGERAEHPQTYRTIAEFLQIKEGHHIVDVGCGLGSAARILAQYVGSSGQVIGVDKSEVMIAEARKRSEESGLPVAFLKADAHKLPYENNLFNGCFCRGVFEIISDPQQVLAEMVRIVQPGGRIIVPAPDAGTWTIDASNRAVTRRIIEFISDQEVNGWIGRQLPRIFKEIGLQSVMVLPETWVTQDYDLLYEFWLQSHLEAALLAGVISDDEVIEWLGELEQRSQAGHFYSAITTFVVSGQKPPLARRTPLKSAHAVADKESKPSLLSEKTPPFSPLSSQEACLHHLFEKQVQIRPDAIALVFQENHITYRVLSERANQLAHHLFARGVGSEVLVGICAERSLEVLIGQLAILKAGGAFLLLDPNYPKERLSFMLQDAHIFLLLTQQHLLSHIPDVGYDFLCLDTFPYDSFPTSGLQTHSIVDQCAYVIYTSGSTGRPKGVQISHRGILGLLQAQIDTFALLPGSRVLQCSSFNFDASIFEIVMALLTGSTLFLSPPDTLLVGSALAQQLREQAISIVTLTPSVLTTLPQEEFLSLQTIISAGEACSIQLVERWSRNRHFFNAYGLTETTIWATVAQLQAAVTKVTIGHALPHVQVYILDKQMKPVQREEVGELYIGGVSLARGYLHRPELTAQQFLPNPFSQEKGARLYRTGDRGRYLANEKIEYLGREDEQVKLHGIRVELGEIEAALRQHPAIQEVVVLLQDRGHDDKGLVAYITRNPDYLERFEQQEQEEERLLQIVQWQKITDDVYSQSRPGARFNTAGWNSSYTKQPLPQEEMGEWVNQTVQRILALQPDRVLEIGCGLGLLLQRIAPQCSLYWGTDFSVAAITALQHQLSRQQLPQVTLLQKMADDFSGIPTGLFNVVILNSVAQHFPNIEYLLQVLEGAVKVITPGGFIFVGDVRSLSLLEAFHTSVQCYHAPDSLSLSQLRRRIRQHIDQEEELTIDPNFFRALKNHLPQISGVKVLLKRGRTHNELTHYRFDAILSTRKSSSFSEDEITVLDWQEHDLTLHRLQSLLVETQLTPLSLRNVPNARLQKDLQMVALLAEDKELETVGDLRRTMQASPGGEAIEPEDLWELGQQLGSMVDISWSGTSLRECYNVVFHPMALAEETYLDREQDPGNKPWKDYANNPLQKKFEQKLLTEIRNFLQQKLPYSMLPASYVLLEQFPLTPHGKIDRKALSSPYVEDPREDAGFTRPRTPTEETVAGIWMDVLKTERVGIHDHFLELGGNSLLAVQVLSRVRNVFQAELSVTSFFQNATVADFAETIDKAVESRLKLQNMPIPRLARRAGRQTHTNAPRQSTDDYKQ